MNSPQIDPLELEKAKQTLLNLKAQLAEIRADLVDPARNLDIDKITMDQLEDPEILRLVIAWGEKHPLPPPRPRLRDHWLAVVFLFLASLPVLIVLWRMAYYILAALFGWLIP